MLDIVHILIVLFFNLVNRGIILIINDNNF
jgi:hypothetical protein